MHFKEEGDLIFLIGSSSTDLASSEYLHKIHGVEFSPAPHFNIGEEVRVQQKVAELINKGLVESAHDVSEGGLFACLLESAFIESLGFDVVASDANIRKDAYWFGEAQSRIVVSVKSAHLAEFRKALGDQPFEELGLVTSGEVEVDGMNWGQIEDWKEIYDNVIDDLLAGTASDAALSVL